MTERFVFLFVFFFSFPRQISDQKKFSSRPYFLFSNRRFFL